MSDVIPAQRTADPSTYVDEDLLLQLLTVTWASFVDPECDLVPLDGATTGAPAVLAEVAIVGDAPIRILLSVDDSGATSVTEMMLGQGAYGAVTAADVSDAIGELVNVLGGNIKSLLPAGSRLTLPTVTHGMSGHDEAVDDSDVVTVVGWGPHTITARITARITSDQAPLTPSGGAR